MNSKRHLLISFTVYLISFLILFPEFQYVINTDAISYFSLAKKYFDGHYSEAINGYFGPLYSWLILPAFHLNVEPLVFARLINVIFSFMLFVLVIQYLNVLNFSKKFYFIVIYYFIIPALLFSFWYITPDYLLLILMLSLILLSVNEKYLLNFGFVLLGALLASLIYLTKSFGLVYFLIFQSIVLIINVRRTKELKKKLFINYSLSIIFFLILISPWVHLISNKYGEFTFSTSGKINLLIVNPELNFHHPSIESGIVPPSDKYAVSAWDDPDLSVYPGWSPLDSTDDMKFFIFNFLKNSVKFIALLILFCPIFVFSLPKLRQKVRDDYKLRILLSALILNGILYSFVYVESRYIWLSLVLFSLVTFVAIQELLNKVNLKKLSGKIIVFLILLSPVVFIFFAYNKNLKDTRGYDYANKIKKKHALQGNIATTNHWWLGLNISYFLNCKFYGEEKKSDLDEKLVAKLKSAGINYLLDYSEDSKSFEGIKLITRIDSLKIYEIIVDR